MLEYKKVRMTYLTGCEIQCILRLNGCAGLEGLKAWQPLLYVSLLNLFKKSETNRNLKLSVRNKLGDKP